MHARGQYDIYELFLELSKKILNKGGRGAFVIPDSIFNIEHIGLREFLCKEMTIDKIIKLGEGFFEDVFRSAIIVIYRNEKAEEDHDIDILIIRKEEREKIKKNLMSIKDLEKDKGYQVPQKRFQNSENFEFNISISKDDEEIIKLIEVDKLDWDDLFESGRGVEFSQSGEVIQCPNCFKWSPPPVKSKGKYRTKNCEHCKTNFEFEEALAYEEIVKDYKDVNYKKFIIGKAVNRYYFSEINYLDVTKDGINYKEPSLYEGVKILIRKTGIGIFATIDYENAYVPQVVFIFKMKEKENSKYRIEYILGVLNSRLMLYYYYKNTGDVEWKSFPYHTIGSIKRLPIRKIDFDNKIEKELHDNISNKVKSLLESSNQDNIPRSIDLEIENLVMDLYKITPDMKKRIWKELNSVQELRIIRDTMR